MPGYYFHILQGFWYRALVDAKVRRFSPFPRNTTFQSWKLSANAPGSTRFNLKWSHLREMVEKLSRSSRQATFTRDPLSRPSSGQGWSSSRGMRPRAQGYASREASGLAGQRRQVGPSDPARQMAKLQNEPKSRTQLPLGG